MQNKWLTIGMATYDDYDGVFFSIQALRLYQLQGLEHLIEIIVIDNNPTGKHADALRRFCNTSNTRYIPYTAKQGTSSREEIFKHAKGEYVLCMDSHVMFEPFAIQNLLKYYEKNPNTKDLIQGPLLYDDLKNISTHFDPIWRGHMYGIWATNSLAVSANIPFEIPMMGLGMFSCKKDAWLGFNPNFRGFGAEEGYIHEKFRKAGNKCICIPDIKWNHRFDRPLGVPYMNRLEDRVWNYFVGWMELTRDINDPIFRKIFEEFNKVPTESINILFDQARKIYKI